LKYNDILLQQVLVRLEVYNYIYIFELGKLFNVFKPNNIQLIFNHKKFHTSLQIIF